MAVPVATIISNALLGHNIVGVGEPIKPADAVYCLSQLNAILDDWAAETAAAYAHTFPVYSTTGVNPETIGPTGTWVMPARPVSIDGVSVDMGSGIYRRIYSTNDPKWWEAQQLLSGGSIDGAYYSPDEPNGSLYFTSPAPALVSIRLMIRTTIGPVAQTDVLTIPQGYESALTLTLQEAIADAFHATPSPGLTQRAGKARARIFSNNLRVRSLSAAGLGLPGTSDKRGPTAPGTAQTGGGWAQGGWSQ
jgi:hypothetical protein